MTREEKIKKIDEYCRQYDESGCGGCPLYGKRYVSCCLELTKVKEQKLDRILRDIEKVRREKKEFTKADLKTGMVAETRAEIRYFVLEQDGRIKFIDIDGSCLSEIYDDLTASKKEDDIMVVYQAPVFDDVNEIADLYMSNGYVLWERQEPREMTVKEIEQELGYKIKIMAPPVGQDS